MNSFPDSNSNNNMGYTQDTNLRPSGIDDINPFKIPEPKEETIRIRIPLYGTFSYSSEVHASVGYKWKSEFDTSAFEMDSSILYVNPKHNDPRMRGADRANKTEIFKALEEGTFTIVIKHIFRNRIYYITTIEVEVC